MIFRRKKQEFDMTILNKNFYVVAKNMRGERAIRREMEETLKTSHAVILQREVYIDDPLTLRIFFTPAAKGLADHVGARKKFRGFKESEIIDKICIGMKQKGANYLEDYEIDVR